MSEKRSNINFEEIYVQYYSRLKRFAKEYVLLEEDAENIVQDVFVDLWERFQLLSSHQNLFAFLFLSTKNKCIDFLRRKTVAQKAEEAALAEYHLTLRANYHTLESFNQLFFTEKDIDALIHKALESLPDKCREIFVKNKIEGKKQKEIARELNISVNTVENQMAIAYRKLRKQLKGLLPLLVFLLH